VRGCKSEPLPVQFSSCNHKYSAADPICLDAMWKHWSRNIFASGVSVIDDPAGFDIRSRISNTSPKSAKFSGRGQRRFSSSHIRDRTNSPTSADRPYSGSKREKPVHGFLLGYLLRLGFANMVGRNKKAIRAEDQRLEQTKSLALKNAPFRWRQTQGVAGAAPTPAF
jgi:hypothetical protein